MNHLIRFCILCLIVLLGQTLVTHMQAATERVLYSFRGGHQDGGWPEAGVILDTQNNVYGTTRSYGPHGYGIVYQLTPSEMGWTERIIHGFCSDDPVCSDGAYPQAGVVFDAAGNLYGTTTYGGNANSWGVVYQLQPDGNDWEETVLCTYDCLGDSYPVAEVTLDNAGRIFGTANGNPVFGGLGDVFELVPGSDSWRHRVLHSFKFNNDGNHPATVLAIDRHHNLFGMTILGGTYNGGTVFEISSRGGGRWAERVIYNFGFLLGGTVGGLTFDKDGNLFGTAQGQIFELTHSGSDWIYTTLYTFGANEGARLSRLTIDKQGNFYGTARIGGKPGCANAYGCGSVFKFSRTEQDWQKSTIYEFRGREDGGNPVGGVVLDDAGNLYGATNWGGLRNCDTLTCGVVYKITP